MLTILNAAVLKNRQKDVEDVIFNTGNIKLYDLKLSFCVNKPEILNLKRKKITNSYSIEILDVCEKNNRFVVNPENKIQKTKNGGTVKLMRLEEGYELKKIQFSDKSRGPSGEFGLNVADNGVILNIDNVSERNFEVSMGKLTHEHLVLIIDAQLERKIINKYDSANINIEYIIINKDNEKELCEAIEYKKNIRE